MPKPAATPASAAPPQAPPAVPVVDPGPTPSPVASTDASAGVEAALRAQIDELTAQAEALRAELAAGFRDAASMRGEIEVLRRRLKGSGATPAPTADRTRWVAIEPLSPVLAGERRDLLPGDEFEAAPDEVAGLAEGVHFKRAG